nr:unnamed protein product [Callosobruchus chinensis]
MHSLVCACHFKDGDRKNGPTIFEHNKLKRFCDEPSTSTGITRPKKLKKDTVISEGQSTDVVPDREHRDEPTTSQQVSVNDTASTEADNYFLRKELDETKEKLHKLSMSFSFDYIKDSDAKITIYTGLPSKEIFMCLYELLESVSLKYYYGWTVNAISKIDQLLLTLVKLKLNLLNEDLAVKFNIAVKTVANKFFTWLYALHEIMFKKIYE